MLQFMRKLEKLTFLHTAGESRLSVFPEGYDPNEDGRYIDFSAGLKSAEAKKKVLITKCDCAILLLILN